MIHFDKNLIRHAEQLHNVHEYADIFNDLARIEKTLNNFDIEGARRLDNEQRKISYNNKDVDSCRQST